MSNTLLIAGKDFPAGAAFADAAVDSGRNVFITMSAKQETDTSLMKGSGIQWNRTSPISVRSMILEIENKYKTVDEALIIFDSPYLGAHYTSEDMEGLSRGIEDLILSYSYLTTELYRRFKEKGHGRLIFLLKTAATPANRAKVYGDTTPVSISVAMAQGAFESFAENMAAAHMDDSSVSFLTIRCEAGADQEICSWLFPYLNETKAKKITGWVKVGAKVGGLLSLFK